MVEQARGIAGPADATGWERATARVLNGRGAPVGAAFLMPGNLIVTCAHVISAVVGVPSAVMLPAGTEVMVDFPLAAQAPRIPARLVFSVPVAEDNTGDIAVLRLTRMPPVDAVPLRVVAADDLAGHRWRAFGFPRYSPASQPKNAGIWTSGTIRGREGTGWWQLAVDPEEAFSLAEGFSGAAVWDDEYGGVVGVIVAVESNPTRRTGYALTVEAVAREWPELRAYTLAGCPYRGLRPFTESDARVFFGRHGEAERLVEMVSVDSEPIVPVLGPSGVGKSSLVGAGLLARLTQEGGYVIAHVPHGVRHSAHELLAWALAAQGQTVPQRASWREEWQALASSISIGGGLARAADQVLGRQPEGTRLLIVVDQFEELVSAAPEVARELDAMLGSLTRRWPNGTRRVQAVVVARIDFLQQLELFPHIASAWKTTQLLVAPLHREALRQVISAPLADLKGIRFAAGLVEQILHDTPTGPGALPLLEYTLTELWNRQERGVLSTAAYVDLGGVAGALAQNAERALWARADASERPAMERVFIQMVRPGEQFDAGHRAPDTRRVADRDEFNDADWNLIHRLASTRLVVITRQPTGPDTAELAHETLIGAWPRLASWVDDNREFRSWQENLRRSMRLWHDHDQEPRFLLDGPALAEARDVAQRRQDDLTLAETTFIDSSNSAAARRRRRRRYLYVAAVIVVVLAVTAGLIAVLNGNTANVRQQVALSDNLAAASDNAVATNVASADLYALAAWQAHQTEQARSSLLSRAADPYLGSFAEPSQFVVATLAVSPDGRLLAVGGTPGPQFAGQSSVQLWDIATRRLLAVFSAAEPVRSVAFSPDGGTLVATPVTRSGNLRMWSVATHRQLSLPVTETGVATSVAYSPDGRLLAVGELLPTGPPGQKVNLARVPAAIDLWDLATHRLVHRLAGLAGPIWSLDFSADGRRLASGGYDGTVRLWDPATGRELKLLTGGDSQVQTVRFEPYSDSVLATGGSDGKVRLWNASTGAGYPLGVPASSAPDAPFAFSPGEPYLYTDLDFNDVSRIDTITGSIAGQPIRLQQPATQMAFSPDGRILILGGPQGSLSALAIQGNTFYNPSSSPLTAAAVDRGGHLAATGAADGTVQVWYVNDPVGPVVFHAGSDVVDAAFSPDGWRLAAADSSCHVRIWDFHGARRLLDLNNARQVADLDAPGASGGPRLLYMAFSQDGRTLATYCANNSTSGSAILLLWDAKTFKRLAEYKPPGALDAGGMAESPDGGTIALDTGTGRILFWNTRMRRLTGQISVTPGTVHALAFSPDGRLLAITTADDTVQLWNLSSRHLVASTTRNNSLFHYLAFSPDGSTLAATAQDSTVRIWQIPSLQLIATLSPPTPPLATGTTPVAYNGLAYTPNGKSLVTASSDSTAQVWDLSPSDQIRNLCDAMRGPQLESQWNQLIPSPGNDPCLP
jgi:WD40 repeat protein